MADIYDLLAQKRSEHRRLTSEIAALELAARLMHGETPSTNQQEGSIPQKVAAILQAEGKPLHVGEIVNRLRSKFKTAVKRNNLSVMLYRYWKRGSRFYKVLGKPNTYGLIEWQGTDKVVAMQ